MWDWGYGLAGMGLGLGQAVGGRMGLGQANRPGRDRIGPGRGRDWRIWLFFVPCRVAQRAAFSGPAWPGQCRADRASGQPRKARPKS